MHSGNRACMHAWVPGYELFILQGVSITLINFVVIQKSSAVKEDYKNGSGKGPVVDNNGAVQHQPPDMDLAVTNNNQSSP